MNTPLSQVHDIAASLGFTLGVSALVGKIWFIYQAATSSGVGRVQGHVVMLHLDLFITSNFAIKNSKLQRLQVH